MKLKPSYVNQHHQEPLVKAVTSGGSTTTVLTVLCLASAFFIVGVAALAFYIQRRRSQAVVEHHTTLLVKRPYEKPITLRKPTAVKSPGTAVGGGILLKKSPSPTGQKSPPGSSSSRANEKRFSSGSDVSIGSAVSATTLSPEDATKKFA